MRTFLSAEWILDGTGAPPLTDHTVIVEGDRIKAVVPAAQAAPEADDRVLSFPGATLMPGLVNAHVHSVLPGDSTPLPNVQLESDVTLALRAAHNIRTALKSGVTTVRDCGGRLDVATRVRDAQALGMIEGSRIVSGGWPITIVGGHLRYFGGEADGEDGLRKMVRRVVGTGADFVKVMGAGGGTPGSIPEHPSFSVDELRVIVDVAHGLGKPVGIHCIATKSIDYAVDAGADIIEHALFFDGGTGSVLEQRVAEKLAESRIPVTTTMQVFRDLVDKFPDDADLPRRKRMLETDRAVKKELHRLGVPLLAGSDSGWVATTFDTFWKELDELVGIGMSPAEAVRAGTAAPAEAMGRGDQYGSIKPGLAADLLIVGGDVSTDVRAVAHVQAVWQAGVLVHQAS